MPKLRDLKFDSLNDVAADITRLREQGYDKGGNWNLSQTCEHLANTMRVGMHGGLKPASWFMRAIVFRPIFELVLLMGKMPSGVDAPPDIVPGDREEESPELIDEALALLTEARDRQEPLPPNPFVAGLSLSKWKRLQLIHSAHHLAFLKAKDGSHPGGED